MGEIVTILFFIATGLSVAFTRVVRRRAATERFTREWIEFLSEDLITSAL